jgi:hypothetical protein
LREGHCIILVHCANGLCTNLLQLPAGFSPNSQILPVPLLDGGTARILRSSPVSGNDTSRTCLASG